MLDDIRIKQNNLDRVNRKLEESQKKDGSYALRKQLKEARAQLKKTMDEVTLVLIHFVHY